MKNTKKDKKGCTHCEYKHTPRTAASIKQMQTRLHRMIGQLNGIDVMLSDNRYCGDILIQIAAVESALRKLGYMILQDHLSTCVVEETKKGNMKIIDETMNLIEGLK